jgi:hypothetical protein
VFLISGKKTKQKEFQFQRESLVNPQLLVWLHLRQTEFLPKGDDPPRDRTSALRAHGFPSRRLGPMQMTTDTALGVTKLVVADKTALANVPYIVRFSPKNNPQTM